jgi:FAD synthase
MKLQSYVATVRVRMSGGSTVLVRTQVQAEDINKAKWLLEAQYGVGNVVSQPTLHR